MRISSTSGFPLICRLRTTLKEIVLPLTLTQIDVTKKGNTNSVNWQTASEMDMDYSKVVSVSGKDGKKTLSVYPNPVKTELNVLSDGNSVDVGNPDSLGNGVSIFNMTGQLIRQFNDNCTKVDVQDLPNGIYFVRLLDKNGLAGEAVRFVKQSCHFLSNKRSRAKSFGAAFWLV